MDLFNMRLSPAAQKSPDELDILGAMILDDLAEEGWTSGRFALACRKHRKLSSFLPTTADLLAADKALNEGKAYQELPALPEARLSDSDQIALNKKWLQLINGPMEKLRSPCARPQ
jgi:hypothetical protein